MEEHSSRYQGRKPFWVALLIDKVNIELVYPSQLQLSEYRPPFPEAQTKIDPFPCLPRTTPFKKALLANGPGPSTVLHA